MYHKSNIDFINGRLYSFTYNSKTKIKKCIGVNEVGVYMFDHVDKDRILNGIKIELHDNTSK